MLWTGSASALVATTGIVITAYLVKKGGLKALWLPLFYFSLLEALQAFTYLYINQCTSPVNKGLTFLAYIHIAFQPFFINMLAMNFIPEDVRNKVARYVYGACWIGAGLYMLKAYPFSNTYLCIVGKEAFCGHWPCAFKGQWHLAWQWPLNTIGSSSPWIDVPPKEYVTGLEARNYLFKGNWEFVWQWCRNVFGTQPLFMSMPHNYLLGLHTQTYIFCGFVLPILYGSWRFIGFIFLFGSITASFSTSNINEFSAIWGLYFLALCALIAVLPVRKYLYVKNWMFYKPILKFIKMNGKRI